MTGTAVTPTPMDRFAEVTADPLVMETVGQRVMNGESLKQIAHAWQIPAMRFVEWVVNDLGRLKQYEAALRIRGDELAHETLAIADGEHARVLKREDGTDFVVDDDPRRDALRVRTRMTLAGHWNREQYGLKSEKTVTHQHRRLASELSDEELMAFIENARRNANAIPGESTPVEALLELPLAKGDGII